MREKTVFTSVSFRNFKALEDFSLKLNRTNILVGPNNAGKSTIISAFRALSAAIRSARVRAPEFVSGLGGENVIGYRIPSSALPMSTENVHTEYAETETSVLFRISNGNRLRLFFPPDGGCVLLPEVAEGKQPRTAATFKTAFPVSVGIVPQLGPLEQEERILDPQTIQRDLSTHRASRQFRNYWYHTDSGFEEFAALVRETWPGMDILRPEKPTVTSNNIVMFCLENRMARELYWAGSGFQVWCQLLTHICNADENTILVIDEPEIYLHPDVQRQLLGILQKAGPDLLLATHSTEILSEGDPPDVAIIDKRRRSALRLTNLEGLQSVFEILGSAQNIILSRLARNQRLIFVEGLNDFRILRRFARVLGFGELAAGSDLTPVESGGFSSNERIRGLAWGFEKVLETRLHLGAIFDRDYWPDEQIENIEEGLSEILEFAHFHRRKEIENYLLLPTVLERTLQRVVFDRARRKNEQPPELEPVLPLLDRITRPYRSATQAQYLARRADYLERRHKDKATFTQQGIEAFDEKWSNLTTRMEIVPGKTVLASLRAEVQSKYSVNLTDFQIIDECTLDEVPPDLRTLLHRLDQFRQTS